MKLFLTSSCVSKSLQKPFLKFLNKSPEQTKLYFIPTASDVEENKFYTCESMDDFAAVGINPIWYALKYKTKEQIARELSNADVIWVNGGNTFYLLDVARKTGFIEIVQDLVRNKGVIYGGTSAGTILASPSIGAASWGGEDADKNIVGLTDLSGFGFVSFVSHVHYDPVKERKIIIANKKELPIYAIPNGSAVEVNGDQIIAHGDVEIL
ncbi:Type 1 glutamine amidotransferase-like domain-containing protein [Candidatus Uhrbacteria bacterium]|nr:Type 1 glutamine amidotransferase-like domain-containing protein [Candidatus Uhrbacteria bacterium]